MSRTATSTTDARAPRRRHWGRKQLLIPLVTLALAIPIGTAGASGPAGQATSETVKVGMIYPITGATTANPEAGDSF